MFKIRFFSALIIGSIFSSQLSWADEKPDITKISATAIMEHGKKPMAMPSRLQNTLWWRIAKLHALDPYILYAVALIESAQNNDSSTVAPWPWALNKSGQAIIPKSQEEAHTILKKSIAEGHQSIDVGLMQINLYWHGHKVESPEQLLNPVTNMKIGAGLLAEAIQSSPDNLALGIGRYHSWQNVQSAVKYGQRVLALADQIRTVI